MLILLALHKTCVNLSLNLPGGSGVETMDFDELSMVSISQKAQHEKSLKTSGEIGSIFRSKIRVENSKTSGTFSSAPFLT